MGLPRSDQQQPVPGTQIPTPLHHSMSTMNLNSTGYPYASYQQEQHLQHPQASLVDKKLPALPSQPTLQIQGRQPDSAAPLQHLAPLSLSSERSFSDELGSYLSEQEAFQPPPPLKEAIQNTASPSASFVSTSRAVSPSPALMVAGGDAAPTNTVLQYQPSDLSVGSTVLGRGYSIPPTSIQTPAQGQEWQVYTPQSTYVSKQQQPSHIRNPSYPAPPPILNASDRVPSPSTLVPSLGIPSPVPETSNSVSSFAVPSGDRAPSPSGIAVNSRGPSPSRLSSSSDDGRIQHVRHLRGGSQLPSGLMSGRASPLPFNNNSNISDDYLKPLPTKSEDWAALVDTPESPTFQNPSSMRQFQNQALFANSPYAYTDSPAEEAAPSNDYMQHLTQQQAGPSSMTHRHVYQHHQHHSSGSSLPLPFIGMPQYAMLVYRLYINPRSQNESRE
ncbi:hypothetical protein BG011_000556 [Mortierella polycephala]|uniref:Uncharacterized protein n=1 Tax=Mortierella polycephala TaxID=41804 RepID=A0A9P6PKC4_9FUNG|nr:hypothetical protein BG011_000556 [Mortierella polycephala]